MSHMCVISGVAQISPILAENTISVMSPVATASPHVTANSSETWKPHAVMLIPGGVLTTFVATPVLELPIRIRLLSNVWVAMLTGKRNELADAETAVGHVQCNCHSV